MNNQIKRALVEAANDKTIVSGLVRRKRDGQFSPFNGQVREIRQSKDGEFYLIVENFKGHERQDGRRWQNVLVKNVLSLKKSGKTFRAM